MQTQNQPPSAEEAALAVLDKGDTAKTVHIHAELTTTDEF